MGQHRLHGVEATQRDAMVRRLRKQKLTVEEIAVKVQLSPGRVSEILRGVKRQRESRAMMQAPVARLFASQAERTARRQRTFEQLEHDPDVLRCRAERAKRLARMQEQPEIVDAETAFSAMLERDRARQRGGRPRKMA